VQFLGRSEPQVISGQKNDSYNEATDRIFLNEWPALRGTTCNPLRPGKCTHTTLDREVSTEAGAEDGSGNGGRDRSAKLDLVHTPEFHLPSCSHWGP